MNLELIDPFRKGFPEVIEDTLQDNGFIITCTFNQRGNFLATGMILQDEMGRNSIF
jgi:hypothetical protein